MRHLLVLYTNLARSYRLLEFHSKTLIPLIGLAIEVAGWFVWNIFLSAIYPKTISPISVRDAFLHAFGDRLSWWTTLLLTLATLIVIELAVQAVRRVYWPTDQDLMQRIEKDTNSKQILRQYAADGAGDLERGKAQAQGIELEEIVLQTDLQREEGVTLLAERVERSQSPQPISAVPRRSLQDLGPRRSVRMSHDDYRPPNFTPLPEERETPYEDVEETRGGA